MDNPTNISSKLAACQPLRVILCADSETIVPVYTSRFSGNAKISHFCYKDVTGTPESLRFKLQVDKIYYLLISDLLIDTV